MKLASGRLLSKDSMGDGNEGIRVLLGLLMSPSPTRVRSVWVSSSTVRRFGRVSMGREMGERWVPNVGWRGGANKHRLAPECPLALELREESRLSERRLEVRAPREGTPFSRVCLKESGVELDTSGGVRRRKSGSTRCSLFRSPRWSLALVLCARLSSSKNLSQKNSWLEGGLLRRKTWICLCLKMGLRAPTQLAGHPNSIWGHPGPKAQFLRLFWPQDR